MQRWRGAETICNELYTYNEIAEEMGRGAHAITPNVGEERDEKLCNRQPASQVTGN